MVSFTFLVGSRPYWRLEISLPPYFSVREDFMKLRQMRAILFGVLLFIMVCAGQGVASEAKTVEVLKNIYTIVHGEGVDSNSTFIITADGVIVIDTRVNPAEADIVLKEIRKHTDLPILYTINTHYHGDHTFGNQVFKESHAIIAHENVRKALVGKAGKQHLERFKSFKVTGLEDVTITPPNMIYREKMELFVGGYHLQLLHLRRGHTDGDTVIYINELRTVIAGDLIFNKKIPYMGDGYVDDWIDSLQHIEDLDNEIVVPGHGDVGGKPLIIRMKHYLLTLKGLVLAQLKLGKSLLETQEAVRPVLQQKFQDWTKLDWIDGNIERAYYEYSLKAKN